MRTITYGGETLTVVDVQYGYGTHPYAEPGDPLYNLQNQQGKIRYTLWWNHGLPEFEQGRVMSIEEYTIEHPYPRGIMRRGELFVEKAEGFSYIDNRRPQK